MAAFEHIPAILQRNVHGSQLHGRWNPVVKSQDSFVHTVYINGRWILPTEFPRCTDVRNCSNSTPIPNGYTQGSANFSWVYYLPIMGQAQSGLGCAGAGSCSQSALPIRPQRSYCGRSDTASGPSQHMRPPTKSFRLRPRHGSCGGSQSHRVWVSGAPSSVDSEALGLLASDLE